ncbi:hypothetical protein [Halalkalibacter akibai]|nr:hypothetical protein [Halalkalibacter akibai]
MKQRDVKRKKKRELLKDFLKKNVRDWKQKTKRNPMPQSSKRTTA